MNTPKLKWEVKKRMEVIERCLCWKGKLGRSDLMDEFGISPQQASADISKYFKLEPTNAIFNRSGKFYQPTITFKPRFIKKDIHDFIEWQGADKGFFQKVAVPERLFDFKILQALTMAISQKQSIPITYQSLTQPEATNRVITPHIILSDGYRYHVRGYCHHRHTFIDFVIGRILAVGEMGKPESGPEHDIKWHTLILLRIGPHPGLTDSQKKIIEHEYGMENHELILRVKEATLIYTLTQLRLDQFAHSRDPAEQQIILLNPEITKLIK